MTFRRVPLAVLAWSAVLTRTNSCRTRTLRTLSLSLFCHTYQMRHRHSLATRMTSMLKPRAPLIWRWRRQMTGLLVPWPHLSQLTTPVVTLIGITSDWWSILFPSTFLWFISLSPRSSELTIELPRILFQTWHSLLMLVLWFLYLSCLCTGFSNSTSRWQFAIFFWRLNLVHVWSAYLLQSL